MTDRGQAEVVGYLLVFSLIIMTIGLVTVSGQAGLMELRDSQRTDNVEEGMTVLANNIDEVVQQGIPSRATEIGLDGGRLSLGGSVSVTITGTNETGEVFTTSRTFRPIVYQSPDGATLSYSNGAVIIGGEDGGVAMVREPRMIFAANQTMIPIANTTLNRQQLRGATESVSGEARVLVRTEGHSRRTLVSTDRIDSLTLTVESPRAAAWASYLDTEIALADDTSCTVSGSTATCSISTAEVTVQEAKVAVSFK